MWRTGKPCLKHRWLAMALLALVTIQPAAAANSRSKELEQALAQAQPAQKTRLLIDLSMEIEADDLARGWDYAKQARAAAVTLRDELLAEARLAAIERRRGDYPDALRRAETTLQRAEAAGDAVARSELLLVIAHTQISMADFARALATFSVLTPLAEASGDPHLLARVYNTLSIAYADAEQIDRSREAGETALRHAKQSGDRRIIANVLNNLGNAASEAGDAVGARGYHERALALRESIDNKAGIADSSQNLAHVAIMENNPAAALPYLDRAIGLYRVIGLKRNLTNAQIAYATALRELGRLDEIPSHLDEARRLAEELNSPTILVRVYRALARYHEARGDFRQALDFERKLAAATDRAIGERSRQRLDALQARYDAERRQHEIDTLRRDQELQQAELATVRWQRYSLAVILVGVIALAISIISRQRLKHRAEERILAETRAGRAAAEAANAIKTRLLHITSHDIRGPLGNVLHMAGELRSDLPGGQADIRLDVIQHEAEEVMRLAQDLLDSAALETGSLVLQRASLDLAEIVHAVIGRMQWRADLKNQKVVFVPPAHNTGLVEADGPRLNQVVSNLVSNALKYSPAGKTVRIELARDESHVRLSVIDEGPGISAEDQTRLFVPFARLSNRPNGGESSHGLGLSIAHELVRLHRGKLLVKSAPGQGSTFSVELPIAAAAHR